MLPAKTPSFWRLLAFRLTLWYGGVLVVSSLLCFLISYVVVVSSMRARADADLLREASLCSDALESGGPAFLKSQMDRVAHIAGINDIFFRVYDASGRPVATSDLSGWGDTALPPITFPDPSERRPRYEDAFGAGHHKTVRVLTTPLAGGEVLQVGISFLQIGLSIQDDQRVIAQAKRTVSVIAVGMVVFAVAGGWLLARRALSGVQQLTSTANEISRGALGLRVPTTGSGNEIDELANTFNRMLQRIQAVVEGMEETNDNIAHELRSPVTRIRGLAETTLTGRASMGDYQEMAASTVEECDRLLAMIDTMLDIAEAEAGVMTLKAAPVDTGVLLRQAAELFEPMAAEREVRIAADAPGGVIALGDVQRLQRVIANLLDNAIKYTPQGGTVGLSTHADGPAVEVRVSNPGDGIAPAELPNIFRRFYRGDKSRSVPGNGLGLSLAQAIVRAHGGRITVASAPHEQTVFTVTLPSANGRPG